MQHVLSVVTFVMLALCFVVSLTTVKPDARSAVTAPSKPAHCKNGDFLVRRDAVANSNGWSVESIILDTY
jgi:hypothetical protein